MERITRVRARISIIIFTVIILLFGFKLYDLQIVETGGGKTDNVTTFTTRVRVKAARGDILDTNGNLLVSNRASYDLVINHYVLITADGTNEYLYKLVKRCQEANVSYTEHFPISLERPFVYELDKYNSSWQGYFQQYLNDVCELDSDISAPLLVERLRQRYDIPAEWTDDEARQVIGLRYEMDLRSCIGSLPLYIFLPDVSDENLSAIMELNIPGLMVEASTVREYNTRYAAHVLGFVGAMNAQQWEKYKDNPDYTMDSEIGQDGFEAAFEEYLHGVDGIREDTVTVSGELVSQRFLVEPKAGSNVEVSIDVNLQGIAEDTMADIYASLRANPEGDGADVQGGAVVAIDVKTGQVLTCASNPTYDLSNFFEDYNEILEMPFDPLYNRALLGEYPPGSTYKMSMVVAGINNGYINSETLVYDRGVYDKYGPEFAPKCLYYTNYGQLHENVNAAVALQVSCNYFFYDLADKIALSAMDDTAKYLGLGESSGIELYENIGHRANAETKEKLHGEEWFKGDQITAAIGQSDNRFTPMQLCVYASTLANRGTRYRATFLNRVVSDDYRSLIYDNEVKVASQFDINDDAYKAYTEGMQLVTQKTDWTGTAYSTFKNYPIAVAAKTGTAENGINDASAHGAFVCYAPADDPQIAIAIYGERAGHGSYLAPIAKAMLDAYFEVGEVGDVATYENQLS
ncbi:MAG: hypothetical protein IKU07_01990 [Oscillospiraceae bacterium]|nr:hypothetical protein [Oscillospiraceae bacterium]